MFVLLLLLFELHFRSHEQAIVRQTALVHTATILMEAGKEIIKVNSRYFF